MAPSSDTGGIPAPHAATPVSATDHLAGLDLVRAGAEVMVFICHLVFFGALALGEPWDHWLENLKSGVVLFFVLSGYLVYRPFVHGPVPVRTYLFRRMARILTGDQTFVRDPLRFLLFAQNYDQATFNGFLGVSWTLQLEVTFYLLLPVLAIVLRRSPLLLVPLGLASLAAAWGAAAMPVEDHRLFSSLFPCAFWCFVPGMFLAHLEASGRLAHLANRWSLVIGSLFMVAGVSVGLWQTLDVVSAIGSFFLVGFAVARSDLPRFRWVAWAAGISYAAYLWHSQLIMLARALPGGPLIATVLTIAVATAVFQVIERPVLRWARDATRSGSQARLRTDGVAYVAP
jgi:peptidoglycan/LPS O-acetylase OafA/YrhL